MLNLANKLESLVVATGRMVAWLTLFMVLLTFVVVILRYFFDFGRIWMQELVTWSHAAIFLLGAAYTLSRDEHVRVDVFYRRVGPQKRAWINIAGTLFMLFPVCGVLLVTGLRYAQASWQMAESSPETGGLAYPMVPLAKTLLVAMIVLLMLQGAVIILRSWHGLRTGQYPHDSRHEEIL
ncbi:MAG: TRAP transporter small permease subunit [Gammaproteobacteria bacterium]|nr:TRAP transporter small permease subunit [Gammaproteobacteria bacterium]